MSMSLEVGADISSAKNVLKKLMPNGDVENPAVYEAYLTTLKEWMDTHPHMIIQCGEVALEECEILDAQNKAYKHEAAFEMLGEDVTSFMLGVFPEDGRLPFEDVQKPLLDIFQFSEDEDGVDDFPVATPTGKGIPNLKQVHVSVAA